tara:strand:- start:6190 stop:6780 length:591 start_codon:yes stop_codon:yes gene_type:complete
MSNENVKDMSMNDNTWEANIAKVQAFLKEYKTVLAGNEEAQESVNIIKSQIKRGAKHPNRRKKFWHAIRVEGGDLEDLFEEEQIKWPVQKGKQSSLPANVQESLSQITVAAHEAYVNFWNDNAIVQSTSIVSDRNKELGGSSYTTAEDYADARVLAIKQRFTKHYTNNQRWNGEFNIEDFNIAPPTVEAESDESSQ